MDDGRPRHEQRINHIWIIVHAKLEELNDAIDGKIVFYLLVWMPDMMFLPYIESLDLPTKARDLAGEVREHQLLWWDAHPVDVLVGGVGADTVGLAAHHREVDGVVRQPSGRMDEVPPGEIMNEHS